MKNNQLTEIHTHQIGFNDVMSQLHSGIGLVDGHSRLTYVNPGLTNILGYSDQELINQPFLTFIEPEYHRFLQNKHKSLPIGQNAISLITCLRKDGQRVNCLLTYSKFQTIDDEQNGAVFVLFDITKEQDLAEIIDEQQLQQAHKITNLNRVMTEIARTSDLEQLLTVVFSSISSATGFTGGGFFTYDSEEPTLFAYPLGKFIKLPIDLANGLRKIRDQRPELLSNNVWNLSEVNPSPQQILLHKTFFNLIHPEKFEDLNTVLVFSYKDEKRTNGIFGFYHQSESAFSANMIEIADILTAHAAIAIENIYLIQEKEILAAEKERLRLSRELHDSVAQGLYSLILYSEASRRALASMKIEVVEENLEEIIHLSREAMRDLRLLIYELRPPLIEEIGFLNAILTRLEAVEKRSGIHAECNIFGESILRSEVENELYWVVHESLNNVLKHANAENVSVDIHLYNRKTLIMIKDDGVGFNIAGPEQSKGVGLKSIAERVARIGGKLKIDSTIGQGTTIKIIVDN
jgi:PAS domain S-box-containing protein